MTLIKSILLGSAAGIVAVAGAQAADLPTKKAAPVVQYVKICNVGGITGWTLPGSDTCFKISGYLTAQFVAGNLNTQYNWGTFATVSNGLVASNPVAAAQLAALAVATGATGGIGTLTGGLSSQRVLVQASDAQGNTTFYRHDTGWTTRGDFTFDLASNTAYGPLIGHIDIHANSGDGLDNTGNGMNLNEGWLTWAGITAGRAESFYSFVGGGPNWANFFSPDRKGFNQPDLLAYTASFGGGFSATLSAESPYSAYLNGAAGLNGAPGNLNSGQFVGNPGSITYGGERWPDIVGALHVTQGWGEAQVSGVLHDTNVSANGLQGAAGYPPSLGGTLGCSLAALGGPVVCNSQKTQTGWGIDAGAKILLPSFGAGDFFVITGAYSQSAVYYSGLAEGMWGPPENGQVNGNGQPMYLADAYFNPLTNQWSTPRAWTVQAWLEHHFSPQFYVDLLAGVGGLNWSNMGGGCYVLGFGCGLAQAVQGPLSPHATTWLIGADLGWVPVTNLNFDLELMYQSVSQERPSGFLGTVYNLGGPGGAVFVPGAWEGNSSGFAGRLRITRYF